MILLVLLILALATLAVYLLARRRQLRRSESGAQISGAPTARTYSVPPVRGQDEAMVAVPAPSAAPASLRFGSPNEPDPRNPGPEIASELFSGLAPDDVDELDDIGRLDLSIDLLRRGLPDRSAAQTITSHQLRGFALGAALFVLGLLVVGHDVLIVVVVTPIITLYLAVLLLRLTLFRRSLSDPNTIRISDEEALAVPGWRLPVYTVLVPAFHEPEVMGRLVSQLKNFHYPRNRLDVKLLLEADDEATIAAATQALGDDSQGFEVVLVPPAHPRTKPKALNYGLTLARGQLLTIYDVEDRPDPLQLRRAAVALARLPDNVVCLQARLMYFNPQQNLITRWFAIEYQMWFAQLLPGLVDSDAPIPLGGTSNHFRRKVLVDIGAWDPFNVTEDADLGVRLHRLGYRTAVLDSVTYEEANSDFVNWVRQRSRWYKGYLQTWLVNMRKPRELFRDLGLKGFVLFNLFVGGTPLLAILNPVFWVMTVVWFVTRSPFLLSLFPMPVYYAGLTCLILGNFVFVYATMLSAFENDEPKLVLAAALTPFYWVMMAIAAAKALLQIVISPSYWEKTFHGLDQRQAPVPAEDTGQLLA